MADPAHEETDRIIKRIEREINKEYAQAEKELREKSEKFMRKFAEKDKKKMADLKAGKMTQKEYDNWRMGQIAIGKRWDEMRDVMAKDLANTSEIARSIAIKHMPEVYAVNYNYGTYDAESQCRMNTSFTLYNADTVERLIKEHPQLLPIPSEETQKAIREGKLIAWDKEKLQSAMIQGILQGDSIPNIAKRLAGVADMNRKSSIRNARTMATGVQNAGRLNAYRRAESKGIEMEKTWVATHDGRTRHWHSELDMVSVPLNESFVNDYGEIEYPGDPGADPANVYNCRCTLLGKAGKVKTFHERLKQYEKDYKMEWDKWRKDHGLDQKEPEKPKEESEVYKRFIRRLKNDEVIYGKIDFLEPEEMFDYISEDEIIKNIAGGDKTKGSCASAAYAYVANIAGYDVRDFRGGSSCEFFSHRTTGELIAELDNGKGAIGKIVAGKNGTDAGLLALDGMEKGRDYVLRVGHHASVIRRTEDGWQYLELQSKYDFQNGYTRSFDRDEMKGVLQSRFNTGKRHSKYSKANEAVVVPVDELASNDEFIKMTGYLNTEPAKEKKGSMGGIK